MRINNNLRQYRQQHEKGLSQAQLAKHVGISETHYQKIEYGKVKPNVYLAKALAKALDTTVDTLFPSPNEDSETT